MKHFIIPYSVVRVSDGLKGRILWCSVSKKYIFIWLLPNKQYYCSKHIKTDRKLASLSCNWKSCSEQNEPREGKHIQIKLEEILVSLMIVFRSCPMFSPALKWLLSSFFSQPSGGRSPYPQTISEHEYILEKLGIYLHTYVFIFHSGHWTHRWHICVYGGGMAIVVELQCVCRVPHRSVPSLCSVLHLRQMTLLNRTSQVTLPSSSSSF